MTYVFRALLVATVAFAAAVAGCTSLLGDFQVGSGGSDGSTGDDATADGSVGADGGSEGGLGADGSDAAREACVPETDAQLCMNQRKNCDGIVATDSCGAARAIPSCGTCTSPQTCGAQTANVCGCTVETDTMFCSRLGKNCGSVTAMDNCGTGRTVASCGPACTSPQTCSAHVPNVCGDPICSPETDAQFCARYSKNCGTFMNIDNCGTTRTANCGATCPNLQTCGAMTPNVCGCIPESNASFCARLNFTCGAQQSGFDNCGTQRTGVSCGSCSSGNSCLNGSCVCNGGSACTGGLSCCSSGCVDEATNSNNCGGCGNVCTSPNTCAGGGTSGICGCSDPGACQRDGLVCGSTTNLCGHPVSCGTCPGRCCGDTCVCSTCQCM